jgi:DNA-binding transcriptional regulator YhcF (GntR family)
MTKTDPARLPFQLDLRSGVPVYRQIMDQVLAAMASGRLTTGDQLPTVRQLAVDLSINPNTVIRAYRELEIRGFLTRTRDRGHLSPRSAWNRTMRRGAASWTASSAIRSREPAPRDSQPNRCSTG